MKIDKNSYFIRWYLENMGKGSKSKNVRKSGAKNSDTVQISVRSKRELLNADIDRQIKSGEPLKGVTYEEFYDYWYDTHGKTTRPNKEMRQEYQQALKGDNASLAEKEWRTNPLYSIPPRLFSSPEVTADREAALEKFRNGGKMSKWEHRLLHTFPNGWEGSMTVAEANRERQVNVTQNKLSKALSDAGIELDENTEIHFELWGSNAKLSGNVDDETLEKVREAFSFDSSDFKKETGYKSMWHQLQHLYYNCHEDEAQKGGFSLSFLKSAEDTLLEKAGGKVTVFDLSVDKNGNIAGLPEELDSYLKEYAIGAFGSGIDAEGQRYKDIESARYMKESFLSAIKTVQSGDYDRLKAMTCHVTYKNGKLEF